MADGREVLIEDEKKAEFRKTIKYLKYSGDVVVKPSKMKSENIE